jgi:hypothetical protein
MPEQQQRASRAAQVALLARFFDYYHLGIQVAILSIPLLAVLLFVGQAHYAKASPIWLWVGALVPAFLVMQHGISLLCYRPTFFWRKTFADDEYTPAPPPPQPNQTAVDRSVEVAQSRRQARRQIDAREEGGRDTAAVRYRSQKQAKEEEIRQFGTSTIALDYLIPTLGAAAAGLTASYFAYHTSTSDWDVSADVGQGIVLGTLGAYVYVLMNLGARTFQRDISSGAAVWSAIQLFLGPILGGVTAIVLAETVQLSNFTRQAFYFFAGLAPRQIVMVIQDAIRRFWAGKPDGMPTRLIPLQTIRGITPEIEDRLIEEGITDGFMLAMANPIRLRRNTPYDERQILAWIDEGLLYAQVPDHAAALQKEGVTGAIDLAYYWEMEEGGQPALTKINALADRVHADQGSFRDVVRRLNEDAQVQLIWSLFQSTGDGNDNRDEDDEG